MKKLIQDRNYFNMYRIEWEKDDISDMVNLSRAKDAIRRYEEYDRRIKLEG